VTAEIRLEVDITAAMKLTKVKIDQLRREACEYHWEHEHNWDSNVEGELPVIAVKGEGNYIITAEGERLLDLVAGMECVNIGYGRHELAEVSAQQIDDLSYWCSLIGASIPAIKLCQKLAEITPGNLRHTFLVSDGSDAVETAMKMARQAQIQSGFPWRYKVISRRGCYHGATSGVMSLEGPGAPINTGAFWDSYVPGGVRHVYNVHCYRCPFNMEYPSCKLLCADAIEHLIVHENPETVAAVVIDPVACNPFFSVPPPDYLPRVRQICSRYGVLLIFDEVVNGFGRTGKMFACQHWNVTPDILCLSKALAGGYAPIAATVATDEVFARFQGGPGRLFHHGHTWGGHPVASAIALRNIEIIEREHLLENAAEVGAYFLEGLKTLLKHPIVGNVEGIGLLLGLDLVTHKKSKAPLCGKPRQRLTTLVRQRGISTLFGFLAPPLTLTKPEADYAVKVFDECLGQVEGEFNLG
jgi:adenosylmethionine-8-amino-7-oxononanoate aminotransferase